MEDNIYKIYNDIEISPRHGHEYKVLKEIVYKDVTVPIGYHTNGADIPRLLWIFWPPNNSSYMPAVIVHDYLTDQKEYTKADKYFMELLTMCGAPWYTKGFFFTGVRSWHWVKLNILRQPGS